MHAHVDLFELAVHTGDHHWELKLRKLRISIIPVTGAGYR